MKSRLFHDRVAHGRRFWLMLFLAASAVLLGGCERHAPGTPGASAPVAVTASDSAQAQAFLEQHWARPLAPQGSPPAALSAQGITLAPEGCGTCHAQQFEDWRTSRHSRAMGPGLMGQLRAMPAQARDQHQDCLRCHAPLAEQADSLVATLEKEPARRAPGAAPALHEHGLMCAGCHVRAYEWHGPPRRDGSVASGDLNALPHGGWKANSAFQSARFCAACHQFTKDEYGLNGKLLENTWQEWQASRHAREGRTCQSCHMPDRRHLWRGIHDAGMVRNGVDIQAGPPTVIGTQVRARLIVTNNGVGHYFPTYVTPKVVLRAYQTDAPGRQIAGTVRETIIARQVTLDLSEEVADTRIAPDAQAVFDYSAARPAGATDLVFEVEVQPDAFYLAFYRSLLQDGGLSAPSRRQLSQARDEAAASPYLLFSRRQPIGR